MTIVDAFVGSIAAGSTATISIGGSAQTVNVLAVDVANKKIEIGLPSGGITGIIADGQTLTQNTSNTAVISTSGIERRVYIALDKGSIEFAAADSIADTNSTASAISEVRDEYSEREYLPGVKWINVAPRPATSLYATQQGGHRDELHVLVILTEWSEFRTLSADYLSSVMSGNVVVDFRNALNPENFINKNITLYQVGRGPFN